MSAPDIFAPGFKSAPYWWEAAPPSGAPPSDVPDRADVAIVGAGYCGLSAALELRRHGLSVAGLEASRIGHAASSLNGGMVSGSLKSSHQELAHPFGADRANALLEEGARCLPFLEELIAREGLACHYRRTGRFVGAHCPAAYAALDTKVKTIATLTGAGAWLVPREQQRAEIGSDYYFGGMVAEASGGLHPALYHRALGEAAARAGATIVEQAEATAITPRAVSTRRGTIQAREVFVATNGYTGTVTPWLRRRLIPLGSYIIATEPLPPETIGRLIPRGR